MHKLGAALVVALVLVLLASARAVLEVRRSAGKLQQLLQHDVATLSTEQELAMSMEEAARSSRMLLLTGDTKFIDQLKETRARQRALLSTLNARATTDARRQQLADIERVRAQAVAEADAAAQFARTGDTKAASMRALTRVEPLRERIRQMIETLVDQEKAELSRRSAAYTATSDRSLRLSALFGGTCLVCAGVFALFLRQALARRREIEQRLSNIFEGAAVAIMEEDYSKVAREFERLRAQGVRDLEQVLQEQPERLLELVKLIKIRDVNPALKQLVGARQDQRLASLAPFVANDTLPVFKNALVALWSGQRSFHSETTLKTLSKQETDAHLTVSFPSDLQREAVVVTFTDVSARKREERRKREALEKSEARLRAVFDQCPVGISMSEPSGVLTYMNPAALRMMRAPAGAAPPRSLDLVMAQDRARIAEWRDAFLAGRTNVSELTFGVHSSAGEVRTLRIQANLVREGEEVRGIVCTIEDATERLRLEEQLRHAQKMEAVGQLAGGVAHDFNNLLTIILNGASLLQPGASKEQLDVLTQVEAAAERAASLTAQLLAFGRKQVLRRRVVDLNELIGNQCRMLQRLVGEKISIDTRLDPGGAPAEVDANLMELLLMNLVLNARDALPHGGCIVISAETFVSADERVMLDLSVSDNGSGIASEHLPHVFEPFFTTKAIGKGTGLGLATVYGIVEQHKGRIEVTSVAGQGTCFHVYLPRAEGEISAPLLTPTLPASGHETILLVEDEAAVRQMVAASLARCGYVVIEAEHGDAALSLWKKDAARIDLLLTDMVMPGSLSGRELALRLRLDRPELKVVYMSGYGAHEVVNEPWSVLVQKPFQLSTLAQALRARLDEKDAAMQAKPLLLSGVLHTRGVGLA